MKLFSILSYRQKNRNIENNGKKKRELLEVSLKNLSEDFFE
jgi:hypothetical protein